MECPVVAIVQARMGSTRFPGKMLASLEGRPLLGWVLGRLRRAARLDALVLATSELDRDTPLADLAAGLGIAVFRGSEDDVLARFAGAAEASGAATVVRVCADNPLIAPEAVDALVDFYAAEAPAYAYNHVPKGASRWPDGFGAEILSAGLLQRLAAGVEDPDLRQHVTLALWHGFEGCAPAAVPCPDAWAYPDVRLDVDTPADLAALAQVCKGLAPAATMAEVLARTSA